MKSWSALALEVGLRRAISDAVLVGRCRVVDIDHRWIVDQEALTKGNRLKVIAAPLLIKDQPIPLKSVGRGVGFRRYARPWFWKASLDRYAIEFWSEVLAYQIGSCMNIGVPPCFPARRDGVMGALSLYMVDVFSGEFLIHGGDLLLLEKPEYERKKGGDHSIQLIMKALHRVGLDAAYPALLRQFLFDALIGNGDRHQDNWGLVVRPNDSATYEWPVEFLPAFDNGSSLGRELSDERVGQMLRNRDQFEAYIVRGTAHVRWEEDGKLEQVAHEELVRRHLVAFPELRATIARFLEFKMDRVEAAVRRVTTLSRSCPGVELSEEREELLIRTISRRRERLVSVISQ